MKYSYRVTIQVQETSEDAEPVSTFSAAPRDLTFSYVGDTAAGTIAQAVCAVASEVPGIAGEELAQ